MNEAAENVSARRRAAKPNSRALLATVALILGLVVYAGFAVRIAEALPDHGLVQGVFIAIAGLAWVWPAIRLIRWAARRPD